MHNFRQEIKTFNQTYQLAETRFEYITEMEGVKGSSEKGNEIYNFKMQMKFQE
jgi:hypothetical protein